VFYVNYIIVDFSAYMHANRMILYSFERCDLALA